MVLRLTRYPMRSHPHHRHYSITNMEVLVIMNALVKCRNYLWESKLEIEIDHNGSKPRLRHEELNVCQQKWVECELLVRLKHVKGCSIVKFILYITTQIYLECFKSKLIHDSMEEMIDTNLLKGSSMMEMRFKCFVNLTTKYWAIIYIR